MIFTALLLLTSASGDGMRCARPAAPTEADARRIALTIIRNYNRTGQPLPPYDVRIERDPDDGGQWIAWKTLRGQRGGGMNFRIDRCTGQVTRIAYDR